MDLCVHFGKPAFIVFISSLYLYFGFSNKHFSIQFNSVLLCETVSTQACIINTKSLKDRCCGQ